MVDLEIEYGSTPELTADMIRAQLDLLVHDEVFRSSKRSVTFMKYVVEQTLNGAAGQIKERTIGVEVFGRDPAYDTNMDHIVRTAAVELQTVDPLKRNQFGGTIGGPVSIPHLFHSDKSFFFFGYQKTINHTAAVSATAATLPTAAQLAGTFANEKACLNDPLNPAAITACTPTGSTFTTTVNPSAYSPVSLALLKYLPPPSQLNANGSLSYQKPSFFNLGEVTARFDQELTPKDRMTVRYFSDAYALAGVLNLKNLLTYAADLGVNIWQPAFKQINSIATTGYFSIGDNPQGFFRRANYTLTDDLHIQLGKHNIAFGYHGEISKVDVDNLFRQPGNFTFNANNTNDAIASFLFGYVNEFSQASGQFFNARDKFNGVYVQDSWKASRNLTLNYGVRYEPFVPWKEIQGRMGSFFPKLWASGTHSSKYPLAPAGLQFTGDQGFNPQGVNSEFKHFMPRVGFAWDVFGNGKTSLRGGSGVFFDSSINSTLFNIYTNTSPFITNVDVLNTNGAKITFADPYGSYGTPNPFPAPQPPPATAAIPPQGFLTYDPFHDFQDPVTYDWNLALEQQLSSSLSMRLAYVAEHSSHEWVPLELNPFVPTSQSPFVNGPRIYNQPGCAANNSCFTSTITAANTGGNTNYNSLQLSVEQRMKYGVTMLFNYTWSRRWTICRSTRPQPRLALGIPMCIRSRSLNSRPSIMARRISITET